MCLAWTRARQSDDPTMVRIDRVTTRTGDDGTTALGDGRRLPKDHPLIAALGAVDEANALFGLVGQQSLPDQITTLLPTIQNDLFDLGADCCLPSTSPGAARCPRIGDAYLARLDAAVEAVNAGLPPLASFVLPGGSPAAAWLHLARTVVRRAERDLVSARRHADPPVNESCVRYLNRLSDLCFVWARLANGGRDPVWQPGGIATK